MATDPTNEADAPTADAPSSAPPIVESSRRWPDFAGGRPIELPDGEVWYFYEPRAVRRRGRPGWSFGAGVPRDIDAILSARFGKILGKWKLAEIDNDRASVVLEAAWFLLARNYAITADELEAILAGLSGWDEEKQADLMAQLIMLVGVALGRAAGLKEVA